jgi:hypothetical protein
MNNKLKQLTSSQVHKLKGIIAVTDVSMRLAVGTAVLFLTNIPALKYVAYYIVGTSVLEVYLSVYKRNSDN